MELSNLANIIAIIGGLPVTVWVTARYVRKQAEAQAMQFFQGVYQEMIKDIKVDRDELRTEVEALKQKHALLEGKLVDLELTLAQRDQRMKRLELKYCDKAHACRQRTTKDFDRL